MKRDMDLVRELLLKIEEYPEFGPVEISIDGRSDQEINYHLGLLRQAGLIAALATSGFGVQDEFVVMGLTWDGHEFLDAAREDTRWNQAKEIVTKRGTGLMFELLKKVLVDLAMGYVSPWIRQSL